MNYDGPMSEEWTVEVHGLTTEQVSGFITSALNRDHDGSYWHHQNAHTSLDSEPGIIYVDTFGKDAEKVSRKVFDYLVEETGQYLVLSGDDGEPVEKRQAVKAVYDTTIPLRDCLSPDKEFDELTETERAECLRILLEVNASKRGSRIEIGMFTWLDKPESPNLKDTPPAS